MAGPSDWVEEFTAERVPERASLLFGVLTGLLGIAIAASEFAKSPELDYQAYYFTGRAVLRGEEFVGTHLHDVSFLTDKEYVYTPITAPVFALYGLFPDWRIGYVLNVALLAAVFLQVGRLSIRYVEQHGVALQRVDRWLILGFCLFSGHSILGMYRGNVDPIMLLLISVGFLAVERGEEMKGGVLWAVAALFKLFPAFLGIWFLYRRAYRAVAAAVATGIGLTLLGVAVFGIDAHVEFVNFILHERSRQGAFQGGLDPNFTWITVRRPLSQFLALSGNQLFVLATAIMAPFVFLMYRAADSELDRTMAFFVTLLVLLITIVPSTLNYVVYLFFPLVALLYLADDPTTTKLFVAGLVLVNVPLYPEHVQLLVDAVGLTGGVGDAIMTVVRSVLTYASVPLWGFLLFLAGCLRYVRLPDAGGDGESSGRGEIPGSETTSSSEIPGGR
jgi:hypothetical protein